ncbi:MAG TPA: hypothetical protein VL576_03760 [Candidatus Paceibacterota bacterium]|jgi:hypothetical protein|nr:hypothetical protein [Candidatus Paceibacterota bacterium]
MKKALAIISAIIVVFFLGTLPSHAQLGTADLSITTIPINPVPLKNVQIRLQSYGFDLSQASISWTSNGVPISSGIGDTTITVVAPADGKIATITATASSTDFAATYATLLLRPASVDLLWEGADSYVPPFYKGRALPSVNGVIRVVAIPAISAPRGITYTWSENGSVDQNASGYEKTGFLFHNDTLSNTEDISVDASSSLFDGSNEITIVPGSPKVVGYLNTDSYIDYANGSSSILNTTDSGAIIHFEPYFFSVPNNISNDLTFSYTDSGGSNLVTGNSQNELRLSHPTDGSQSQFNVGINTVTYTLQNLKQAFTLNFN